MGCGVVIVAVPAGWLDQDELKRIGIPALKMSCIPGLLEGIFIAFASVSFAQGGMLGFIIAAVSPAVVVPFMLKLMENDLGNKKGVPTLILAGASIDDVFAITIFSAFLGLYSYSKGNSTGCNGCYIFVIGSSIRRCNPGNCSFININYCPDRSNWDSLFSRQVVNVKNW